MIRGDEGFIRCQNYCFTTKFVWKVAFNTQKVPTGTSCMSRKFHVQPLTDVEFWFQITKDDDIGGISFFCYKNNRYPLVTNDKRCIEIDISIDDLHTVPFKQILNDKHDGVHFSFPSETINKLRQQFTPVWRILWKFSFMNFENFRPKWRPLTSISLNDTDDRDFSFWDCEKFLKSGEFSDITLEVSSREYKVHKCILAYRSNISKELLENDKIVLKTKHVLEDEMDFILKYMYTGSIKILGKLHILRIYTVARELGIPSLADACSRILVKAFNPKTVLNVAEFVEPCVDQFLLMEMTVFVVHNFREISNTERWLEFKRDCRLATCFEQALEYYELARVDLRLAAID